MKTESEGLLHALFDEATEARTTTLELVVKGARRRRQVRTMRRSGGAAAALLAVGIVLWPRPPAPSLAEDPNPSPTPPADRLIVRTVPLGREVLVSSRMGPSDIVRSVANRITVVRTSSSDASDLAITDDELLALVAGRPAALVSGDGGKRLVVAGEDGWSTQ
ncbi:MAG: hypothetical protein H7A46_23120 [Verrucomicrobiales bacterium]|nr:hypothetical protein [Verrucomicrobiales bacterium]